MTATVSAAKSSTIEGALQTLVDAITDYAIYVLDPHGLRHKLEHRCSAVQGVHGSRNHRRTFLRGFTFPRI